jgi:hypothetical protein
MQNRFDPWSNPAAKTVASTTIPRDFGPITRSIPKGL